MAGPLRAQALGGLEPVHRLHPIKVLGHHTRLVALHRTDHVPDQRQIGQQQDFLHPFLDVVLAKRALPGGMRLAHRLGVLGFGNSEQAYVARRAAGGQTSGGNSVLNLLESAVNRRHNG